MSYDQHRANVRNYCCGLTIEEMRTELRNSVKQGHDKKAKHIQEFMDEVIGEDLIELLGLKTKSNGRVDTNIGDKTPLGLTKTVRRLVSKYIGE